MVKWSIFICLLSSYDLLQYIFAYALGPHYKSVYFTTFKNDKDLMALKWSGYNTLANAIEAAAFTLG